MPSLSPYLTGVTIMSASFLLGAFYTHWIVDHGTIWEGSALDSSIRSTLVYYHHIANSPAWYTNTLGAALLTALASSAVKMCSSGTSGMLFDGASFMLLCSALAIYSTNVRGVLAFLPSEPIAAGTPIGGPLLEALRSIAGSHMIIAVSLTGVMSLQAAQGYSDKPSV